MYKVFYNQRTVLLSAKHNYSFNNKYGIYYRYNDNLDIKPILDIFEKNKIIDQLHVYSEDLEHLFKIFSSFFKIKAPDDKILVIKRRGKWDLPKGKIEPGESNEEGALREVEEECGISNLELKKLITTTYHTYTLNNEAILKRTFWYDMEHSSNSKLTPQTEEEISEVKWLSENDINMVLKNTFPSIIEVLKKGDFLNNNIY
jgi:8-oxo-dGTP pyrophosphatase MutT (NUDIX family)